MSVQKPSTKKPPTKISQKRLAELLIAEAELQFLRDGGLHDWHMLDYALQPDDGPSFREVKVAIEAKAKKGILTPRRS